MLHQIPTKQSYRKPSRKKKKKVSKTYKIFWGKQKNKIIMISSLLFLIIITSGLRRFFFHNKRYMVKNIIIHEYDKPFIDTGINNFFLEKRKNNSYWKLKRTINKTYPTLVHHKRIKDIKIISFQDNTLETDIRYYQPEIVFSHQEKKRGSLNKDIILLSTGNYDNQIPSFVLPRYHSGDIQGIFHHIPPSQLQKRRGDVTENIHTKSIEYHPGNSKIFVYTPQQRIAFNLLQPFDEQREKYQLLSSHFTGNITDIDLSSAPYAIIKP